MRRILYPLLLALGCGGLGSCDDAEKPKASAEERRDHIQRQEAKMGVPGEAEERKQRSLAVLRVQGVPFIQHLPVIETEAESKRRTTEEVARRAVALAIVAARAQGASREEVGEMIREQGAESFFSPEERRFLDSASPSEQDRAQFVWRYEASCVLLWALGFVDRLERPDKPACTDRAVLDPVRRGREAFMRDARLRPQRELLDADDLIYRYHWAAVDARVQSRPPPTGVDPDVVMERHYALNWLVGYMDQEWDDVSTDT